MHDPELREYVKYLTMECLRQLYYDHYGTRGMTLSMIYSHVYGLVQQKTGATDDLLKKAGLNPEIILSVLNEIIAEHYGDTFIHPRARHYRLTKPGVEYVKSLREPPKPSLLMLDSSTCNFLR